MFFKRDFLKCILETLILQAQLYQHELVHIMNYTPHKFEVFLYQWIIFKSTLFKFELNAMDYT